VEHRTRDATRRHPVLWHRVFQTGYTGTRSGSLSGESVVSRYFAAVSRRQSAKDVDVDVLTDEPPTAVPQRKMRAANVRAGELESLLATARTICRGRIHSGLSTVGRRFPPANYTSRESLTATATTSAAASTTAGVDRSTGPAAEFKRDLSRSDRVGSAVRDISKSRRR
jgi:hypothetical protein